MLKPTDQVMTGAQAVASMTHTNTTEVQRTRAKLLAVSIQMDAQLDAIGRTLEKMRGLIARACELETPDSTENSKPQR
jgi:hypothetical protein